jgi:hypothetical protein
MTRTRTMLYNKVKSTKRVIFLLTLIGITACSEKNAQQIIDAAIAAHGGKTFENVSIDFDFRGRHYQSKRENGKFTYTRSFTDSTGRYRDELSNAGFVRYKNDSIIDLPDERVKAFTNSVNSVLYFALLPYGLNDEAVVKTRQNDITVNGKKYFTVKVTFKQEGGGTDFDDEFIYWINTKTFTVDYMAYSYNSEGGGLRFREAYNPQVVGGIRFQNYNNFKPEDEQNTTLEELMNLFIIGGLKPLSQIEMENIEVSSSNQK